MANATQTENTGINATDNASITITNATVGETYTIYQMLDLTYVQGQTSYSYTIDPNSAWYAFFTTGDGASYVSVDATTYQVTWTYPTSGTDSWAQAFAEKALAYAQDATNGVAATAYTVATDTTLTFSQLNFGYYLVDSTLGSLLTLDSTDPSVTVTDKNTTPTLEKEV